MTTVQQENLYDILNETVMIDEVLLRAAPSYIVQEGIFEAKITEAHGCMTVLRERWQYKKAYLRLRSQKLMTV
jgi:hypothetical protein